jgi:hypothetical protein
MIEVYGYLEDGSISALIDDVYCTVPDRQDNIERQRIAEEWEGAGNTIRPYEPPSIAGRYILFKSEFVKRMADDTEAAVLEQVLEAAGAKLRLLYNSVEYFQSDDPLFETLKAAITSQLGSDRATELLARPD